jgi:hypothetical protein
LPGWTGGTYLYHIDNVHRHLGLSLDDVYVHHLRRDANHLDDRGLPLHHDNVYDLRHRIP